MDVIRIVDVTVLIVLLIVDVRLLLGTLNFWRIYAGISKRRLDDASSFAPPAAPEVATLVQRLEPLGFTRIGERSLVLPGEQRRRFEWNLVDEPTTTYISLAPSPAMAGGVYMVCYSAFPDGAFVETSFPRGPTVRRTDLYAAPAGTTPQEAVAEHRRRIVEFTALHGPPLANRSMADLLVRDDTYRRRHGGITLRRRAYLFLGLTAIVTIAAALQLIRVVAPPG